MVMKNIFLDFFEFSRKFSKELINAPISLLGIDQCKNESKNLIKKFPNIKKILLSPMRRVIQTFEY